MDNDILMRIIELFTSLLLEGIILGMIFHMISNKSDESMRKALQEEMNNIEKQNKHETLLLHEAIKDVKTDVISQIKESKKFT